VSNFYGNLQAVCDEAGLTPSTTVTVDSTLVGCKKPDPRIFQAALDALRASPAEAVFVGDSLRRDMAGARGMGMRHVWLRATDAAGNGGPCCPEDQVIARLADLLRLDL
jgi:putative hydrolase of the HAD superfamily